MPFLDRYWWMRPLLGFLILAGGAGAIIPLISSLLDLQRDGVSIDTSEYVFVGFAILFFLALALGFGLSTFPAIRRKRSRLAAIAGDTPLMPLAKVELREQVLPDLTREPLSLQWHTTNHARVTTGLNIAVGLLSVAGTLLPSLILLIALIVEAIQEGTLTSRDLYIPLLALIVAVIIAGCVIFGRLAWRALQNKPFGVVATHEGLSCRTQLGREVFLRWEDVRLFEVEPLALLRPTARTYRLYTARDAAVWSDNSLSQDIVPVDVGAAEMAHRVQLLIAVIHAHTGLYPRAFAKVLQVSSESVSARKLWSQDTTIIILLLLALNGAAGAFAASLLLVPFSDLPTLNIVSAAPLLVVMLVEAILIGVWRRSRSTRPAAPPSSAPEPMRTAPAPSSAAGAFIFTAYPSPARRWTNAVLGIILVVELLPGVLDLVHALNLPPLAFLPATLNGEFGQFAGFVLGAFGIVGIMLLLLALIPRATFTVRVEEAGLSFSDALMQIPFTWEVLQSITVVTRNGIPRNYEIRDKAGKLVASWRTNIPAAPRTTADLQPISSDELAGLVSARSGIPIKTRVLR